MSDSVLNKYMYLQIQFLTHREHSLHYKTNQFMMFGQKNPYLYCGNIQWNTQHVLRIKCLI